MCNLTQPVAEGAAQEGPALGWLDLEERDGIAPQ